MSKQDRTAVRTASELSRRYGKKFSEVMGVADDAQQAAEEAKKAAEDVDEMLTSEEIFKRLTNDGESQGLYRSTNGDLYVNGQFIMAGTFTSTASVYIEPGIEEFETVKNHLLGIETIPADRIALYDTTGFESVSITDLINFKSAMLGKGTMANWPNAVKSTVTVTVDASNVTETVKISGVNMWGREVELCIGIDGGNIGRHKGNLLVDGRLSIGGDITFGANEDNEPTLALGNAAPKTLSWKANGDGTYTLIGED